MYIFVAVMKWFANGGVISQFQTSCIFLHVYCHMDPVTYTNSRGPNVNIFLSLFVNYLIELQHKHKQSYTLESPLTVNVVKRSGDLGREEATRQGRMAHPGASLGGTAAGHSCNLFVPYIPHQYSPSSPKCPQLTSHAWGESATFVHLTHQLGEEAGNQAGTAKACSPPFHRENQLWCPSLLSRPPTRHAEREEKGKEGELPASTVVAPGSQKGERRDLERRGKGKFKRGQSLKGPPWLWPCSGCTH